jgi:hypothetical protein
MVVTHRTQIDPFMCRTVVARELQRAREFTSDHYIWELPEGEDRPDNVLGWMSAMDTVEKRVGTKKLISVFGRGGY